MAKRKSQRNHWLILVCFLTAFLAVPSLLISAELWRITADPWCILDDSCHHVFLGGIGIALIGAAVTGAFIWLKPENW